MTISLDIEVESEFLSAILQNHRSISKSLLKSVEPEYFSIDSYKWLVERLVERNWEPFASGMLDQLLIDIEDQEVSNKYKGQIYLLFSRNLTFVSDAEQKFKMFVAYSKINSGITKSYEGFGRSRRIDLLLNEVIQSASDAKIIIEDGGLMVRDLAADYVNRQTRRRNVRDNPNMSPRILTGIPGMDEQFIIKAPMLIDFLAPFKRFKSIMLNAFSFAPLLQGFNVAHMTYENSYELTSDRYDSMFSGINYERISNLLITKEEKVIIDKMWEWINSWNSRIKIIKCISQNTTVQEVEDKLKRLQDEDEFYADVEVWDYLNIIGPSKRFREERHDQKQIVWDLKGHADKFNVVQITASQANMEGAGADRLKLGHRGKSIDISQGIDIQIAIDQTDKEKEDGILVLSPMFSRNSRITIPEIILDTDIPRMQIDPCMYKLWDYAARINPFLNQ